MINKVNEYINYYYHGKSGYPWVKAPSGYLAELMSSQAMTSTGLGNNANNELQRILNRLAYYFYGPGYSMSTAASAGQNYFSHEERGYIASEREIALYEGLATYTTKQIEDAFRRRNIQLENHTAAVNSLITVVNNINANTTAQSLSYDQQRILQAIRRMIRNSEAFEENIIIDNDRVNLSTIQDLLRIYTKAQTSSISGQIAEKLFVAALEETSERGISSVIQSAHFSGRNYTNQISEYPNAALQRRYRQFLKDHSENKEIKVLDKAGNMITVQGSYLLHTNNATINNSGPYTSVQVKADATVNTVSGNEFRLSIKNRKYFNNNSKSLFLFHSGNVFNSLVRSMGYYGLDFVTDFAFLLGDPYKRHDRGPYLNRYAIIAQRAILLDMAIDNAQNITNANALIIHSSKNQTFYGITMYNLFKAYLIDKNKRIGTNNDRFQFTINGKSSNSVINMQRAMEAIDMLNQASTGTYLQAAMDVLRGTSASYTLTNLDKVDLISQERGFLIGDPNSKLQ